MRFAMLVAALGMLTAGWPVCAHAQQNPPDQTISRKRSSAESSISGPGEMPVSGYAISPGDLLEVFVVGVPQLSRSYRVSPTGQITLPMLDRPIAAQGRTPNGLAEAIAQALRRQRLVSHPDVLVSVTSSPGSSVAVNGSVAKPGVYPVFAPTTIVAILSRAGGLARDAGSTAIIMRGPEAAKLSQSEETSGSSNHAFSAREIVKVPIRHLLDTGDEAQNLPIYPGDEIDVPRAGVVYVVGAVNRAGGFALTGEQNALTVLQAIALADNVTRTALLKHAVIIRQDPKLPTGRKQIRVNLKRILDGKSGDRELTAGDILFVPDSRGKQVLARALAAVTSVAIYRAPL